MLRDKGNREVEGTSRLFEELDQCCTLCAREYTNINDRGGGKKKTKKNTHKQIVYRTTVLPVGEL